MSALVLAATMLVVAPATTLAIVHGCADAIPAGAWDGNALKPSNGAWAVRATIDVSPAFDTCYGGFSNNSASAWVGLTPQGWSGPFGSAIVQVGIVDCETVAPISTDDPCFFHPDQKRFFWAIGGCSAVLPSAHDLGPADGAAHNYMIILASDRRAFMYIDSQQVHVVDNWDSGVYCWINTFKLQSNWYAEQKDHGDSVGSSSSKTIFTGVQYKNAWGGSWYGGAGLAWTSCDAYGHYDYYRGHCEIPSSTSFRVWDD